MVSYYPLLQPPTMLLLLMVVVVVSLLYGYVVDLQPSSNQG